jgi:hypothetical protein
MEGDAKLCMALVGDSREACSSHILNFCLLSSMRPGYTRSESCDRGSLGVLEAEKKLGVRAECGQIPVKSLSV